MRSRIQHTDKIKVFGETFKGLRTRSNVREGLSSVVTIFYNIAFLRVVPMDMNMKDAVIYAGRSVEKKERTIRYYGFHFTSRSVFTRVF